MRVTNHLKFLKNPDKGDPKTFVKLEKVIGKWISTEGVANQFVSEILAVFHNALDKGQITFIREIFFPNQLTLRATYARQDFILSQFKRAKRIVKQEARQIALENVYRSVVSDLFDPYLSILVASVQLKDGTFQSFELANLEKGEFNKYEFLKKRLNPNALLRGYFPTIRNAISHAGSHGVSRNGDHIIFKTVKRGGQPSINDTNTVTTGGLTGYIQDLIDFIVSIEAAVNIIGLDLKQTITETPELAREFQSLIAQKQLAARRRKKDDDYGKIWNKNKLSSEAKREHFLLLFAHGCQKNEMPANTIQFKDQFVIIQIPRKELSGPDDKFLVNRVAELINYLLLAEIFFHFNFTDFLVEEAPEPGKQSLQLWLKAADLKAYNIGEAHILDLMHDGKLFRDEQHQPIIIDFDKLDETDLRSLKFGHKRKTR